jgi:transposase-like protein
LDIVLEDAESELSYRDFFEGLKERGVKKVDLVISDGHRGIKTAASKSFTGSSWQLCTVHVKRNLIKIVPKKDIESVLAYLDDVLHAKDIQDAHSIGHGMIATYEKTHPKLTRYLESNLGDIMTFLAFPRSHHKKIRSTNMLERFNKEVKRRTRVIGAIPSENSVLRLLVPLAVETNAKWLDRRYVSWENLTQTKGAEEEFTENF